MDDRLASIAEQPASFFAAIVLKESIPNLDGLDWEFFGADHCNTATVAAGKVVSDDQIAELG